MNLKYNTMESITLLSAWFAFLAYVSAPKSEALGLPYGLHIGDFFALTAALGFIFVLIRYNGIFPVPAHKGVFSVFLIYVLSVLVLPLFGIVFYNAPIEMYFGDLRWSPILVVGFTLLLLYHVKGREFFVPHFEIFLIVLTCLQLLVLFCQFAMSIFGGSANFILNLWYPRGDYGYGLYGYHLNRYAAGLYTASELSRFGGIIFLFSILSQYLHLEKGRFFDIKYFFLFASGLLFLFAAGNRSMLFGIFPVLIAILFFAIFIRNKVRYRTLFAGVYTFAGIFFISVIVFYYNIGRIASSSRLINTIHWLTGQKAFYDISGRGEEIWQSKLNMAFAEWGGAGTLVNPSHALETTMDSYFVFAIAQGGPFIIFPFLILCTGLIGIGLWKVVKIDYMGAIVLCVVVPILLSSVAQNTMTGLSARVFLVLAICGLYISKINHRLNADSLF